MFCANHAAVVENLQPCDRCHLSFCGNCRVVLQGKQLCGPCKNARVRAVQSGRPEGELRFASTSRRLSALWFDGLCYLLPVWILFFGLISRRATATGAPFWAFNFLFYVGPIIYEGLFLSHGGQTPGKKYLGIKVVKPDGADISTGQAWGRATGKTLINVCAGIGYLPAFFTREKTCVHDVLARTRVVRI